jgi:hypothetical protein
MIPFSDFGGVEIKNIDYDMVTPDHCDTSIFVDLLLATCHPSQNNGFSLVKFILLETI